MGNAFVFFPFAAPDDVALYDGNGFLDSVVLGSPALFNQFAKPGFNLVFFVFIHCSIFQNVIIGPLFGVFAAKKAGEADHDTACCKDCKRFWVKALRWSLKGGERAVVDRISDPRKERNPHKHTAEQ